MVVALTPFKSRRRRRRRRAAADRAVHRDLGHLRQCRRPGAELPRRRQAARRGAAGLEGAARARQPARPRRLRLRDRRRTCAPRRSATSPTIAGAPRQRRAAAAQRCRAAGAGAALERIADVPIYATDALVRRAPSLQLTADARAAGGRRAERRCGRARPAVDGDTVRVIAGRRRGRAAGARRRVARRQRRARRRRPSPTHRRAGRRCSAPISGATQALTAMLDDASPATARRCSAAPGRSSGR